MPKYLTCPYCPAQSYPDLKWEIESEAVLQRYICPAKHLFFIPIAGPHEVNALATKDTNSVQTER